MTEPDIGDRKLTGYPFGFTLPEWQQELRYLTVAELEDMLEIKQWIFIDRNATEDHERYFFSHQINALISELERRKQLLQKHANNPLAPQWREGSMKNHRERIARIKERLPIDLFLERSLGCTLVRQPNGSFLTRCPFPNHDDKTPSFKVNVGKQVGYCFGCQRGGDVITIARWYLNTNSFMETLVALEKEGDIYGSPR